MARCVQQDSSRTSLERAPTNRCLLSGVSVHCSQFYLNKEELINNKTKVLVLLRLSRLLRLALCIWPPYLSWATLTLHFPIPPPPPPPPPPLQIPVFCVSVDIFSLFPRERRSGSVEIIPTFSRNPSDPLKFFSWRVQKNSVVVSVLLVSSGASVVHLQPWLLFQCSPDHVYRECGELKPAFFRTDPADCTDALILFR